MLKRNYIWSNTNEITSISLAIDNKKAKNVLYFCKMALSRNFHKTMHIYLALIMLEKVTLCVINTNYFAWDVA